MDSAEKRKIIIIISIVALLVLGVIVVFATLPGDKDNTEDLSVRVQDDGDVTVDKMMASGENKPGETGLQQSTAESDLSTRNITRSPDEGGTASVGEENAEVLALQKQLRTNKNTRNMDGYSVPVRSGSYGSTPSYHYSSNSGKIGSEEAHNIHGTPAPSPEVDPEPVVQKPRGRFFSTAGKKANTDNAIAAVVHGNQTVTNGSTLKMHLLQDMSVNGTVIPKNSFVYGTVSFAGERMTVKISSIRLSNSIYPVNLDVYDRDGIKGIYVPGNIKAEAKGDMTEAGVSEVTPTGAGIIGSVTRAATSVGKAVFSRKAREQKATVRTNYKIYLQWGKS